ncbi:enoyl-CoA hydratase [Temperatibacter marinus]|uniref:Enoyl-CoA hydratase n=1 Tax=Temperatibacter marinus TaxID=1456591 RepID=A0AA52EGF4_9PROT|nr:enoyl-CoA hydratase [Temperatibacter marinus]WND02067.1 enoyl-CoA hydratase [Temperatibacter marinus]
MSDVLISRENNIITIQFNRPEKKNAITGAMYDQMSEVIEEAEKDTAVRAILLKGTEGCFTSGNDLHDFMAFNMSDTREELESIRFLRAIVPSSVPVIAAVDGLAIGIGTTMLLHCDQIVTTRDALYKMPFTELALVPEAGSSYMIPQKVGHSKASDLLLTGRSFSGEEAHDWHIATHLTESFEDCHTLAEKLADDFNHRPPAAIRKSKKLIKGDMKDIVARLEQEGIEFGNQLKSPECAEAIQAFMQRRKPDWSKFG